MSSGNIAWELLPGAVWYRGQRLHLAEADGARAIPGSHYAGTYGKPGNSLFVVARSWVRRTGDGARSSPVGESS